MKIEKRVEATDAHIINKIKERISGVEYTIEDRNTVVKENAKSKNILTYNIQEIQDTMKKQT